MRILIDADACPVTELAIKIAKEDSLEVLIFFDDSHIYTSSYARVYITSRGQDSVDYLLLSNVLTNDIVITQDYGLASLALAKNAKAINQNGLIFTDDNIDTLLNSRYLNAKIRNSGGRTKGPKKRTKESDISFEEAFRSLIR